MISGELPLWPGELYTSLMRTYFLQEDPVNICVCGCGCVGCDDTEVYIEETDHFVIWHDFLQNEKPIAPGLIFIFDRAQYYAAVDSILDWADGDRLAYYIGNVFTVWSDDLRYEQLADHLSDSCVLYCDFTGHQYVGKETVLYVLRKNLLKESYEQKVAENYFYRVNWDDEKIKDRGYNSVYLELCHHEKPDHAVMFITYKTDSKRQISEILLSRNQSWFKPFCWSAVIPMDF